MFPAIVIRLEEPCSPVCRNRAHPPPNAKPRLVRTLLTYTLYVCRLVEGGGLVLLHPLSGS